MNGLRVIENLQSLRGLTIPDQPFTRRAFTAQYLMGRAWIIAELEALGITPFLDATGNLRARLEGLSSDTIYFGSHSDTVPNGGAYDGILGVVAGLELLRIVKEQNVLLNYSLEFIDFLAEETTDWGISCVGSRGLTGSLTESHLLKKHPETGETLQEAMKRMGANPKQGLPVLKTSEADAFIELHIEQGPVLERLGIDVGIVTSLVGITRLQLDVIGVSNHSGTTPMLMRQDALVAASKMIVCIHEIALEVSQKAQEKGDYFVATCGKISNSPNAINVVPGHCEVMIDVRTSNHQYSELFITALNQSLQTIASISSSESVEPTITFTLTELTKTAPSQFDLDLASLCQKIADEKSLSSLVMTSGAGHDAAFMANIMKTLMIFIPSVGGLSHNPKEESLEHDIIQGVMLFTELILKMNRDKLL